MTCKVPTATLTAFINAPTGQAPSRGRRGDPRCEFPCGEGGRPGAAIKNDDVLGLVPQPRLTQFVRPAASLPPSRGDLPRSRPGAVRLDSKKFGRTDLLADPFRPLETAAFQSRHIFRSPGREPSRTQHSVAQTDNYRRNDQGGCRALFRRFEKKLVDLGRILVARTDNYRRNDQGGLPNVVPSLRKKTWSNLVGFWSLEPTTLAVPTTPQGGQEKSGSVPSGKPRGPVKTKMRPPKESSSLLCAGCREGRRGT